MFSSSYRTEVVAWLEVGAGRFTIGKHTRTAKNAKRQCWSKRLTDVLSTKATAATPTVVRSSAARYMWCVSGIPHSKRTSSAGRHDIIAGGVVWLEGKRAAHSRQELSATRVQSERPGTRERQGCVGATIGWCSDATYTLYAYVSRTRRSIRNMWCVSLCRVRLLLASPEICVSTTLLSTRG